MAIAPGLGFCQYPGCTVDPTTGTITPIVPPPPPTGGAPGTPGTGNRPPGAQGGNLDLFTKIVIAIASGGIGNVLGGELGGIGATVGPAAANILASTLATGKLPLSKLPDFVLGEVIGGFLPEPAPSVHFVPGPAAPAPQPFDPGGLGGGALTVGPYLQATGQLVGGLLKGKRIKIGQLLTGGNVAAISKLVEKVI